MKFLISLAAFAALTAPATAEAHNDNSCGCSHATTAVVATPAISIVWVWVPTNRVAGIRAHWSHPVHGREFTNRVGGRPIARPSANATWVTGHWTGNRRTRHWVSGHWNRQPHRTRPSRQTRRSRR